MSLYAHQEEGVELLKRGSFLLAHDPGLGKSRTALTAFRALHMEGKVQQLIIVCPAIAKQVWASEALQIGLAPPVVLSGRTPPSVDVALERYITILNYDILAEHVPLLRAIMNSLPCVLLFDESHHLRSSGIRRSKAAAGLAPYAERVWCLTGTPMVNSALDLHRQLKLLGSRYPYRTLSDNWFGGQYCKKRYNPFKMTHKYDFYGVKDEELLMRRLHPVLDRKLAEDCLDLPERLRNALYVASQPQLDLVRSGNVAAALGAARAKLSPLKARLTIEYLTSTIESIRPVVVFGYHHEFLNRVGKHFEAPVISGDTSSLGDAKIIEKFQQGFHPILVCQMQAAGQAITLTRAHHAVFGEMHWSAVDHRQAERRIDRIGQTKKPVFHYLLVANSVDDLVYNKILQKGVAIDKVDKAAQDVSLSDLVPLLAGEPGA